MLVRASRRARPVAVPPMPASEPRLRSSFKRLGRVLGMSSRTIHRRVIEGIAEAPYSNVTVKTDVPRAAFNYLKERKDEFPGVDVEKLFLRSYPHKELAAQLFGTLREISPGGAQEEELPRRRGRARASARTGSRRPTTATCAARTASRASSSTRSATATTAARSRAASPSRASGCA